ncbi:hypothetical protein FYK55_03160 [Roseiconus nitratireducens]|uniref:Exostosin family protein n=1 Tax=Roseiconus nitratireducens TaxID=2605748 RepID=A0A5M6DHS9_9BACT|nr:hypothetical protein [Roseiconus nitratireducens]KAA5545926.1 hypothetical protein FYK55_03160 [Roseiconus nitratireducens]
MRWKHWFRYPTAIRRAKHHLTRHGVDPMTEDLGSSIGLDLYTDDLLLDCGRHLACIAEHARRIQSPVILRCSKWLLASIAHKKLGQRFLSQPSVRWIAPRDRFTNATLVFTDYTVRRVARDLHTCRTVRMMIGRQSIPDVPVMPYPMHPVHVQRATPEHLDQRRQQPKAGIFFAGNQKSRYGRDSMADQFGVLPRLQILEIVRRHFPDQVTDLQADGNEESIVLRDSQADPIASEDWLPTLASHRFFLCCPGASQPVCHNLVESMSVGVVPILEYGDRLSPPLTDGVNAIRFHGEQGLIEAIRRIRLMHPEQKRQLSHAAAEYYDRHLDGANFLSDALHRQTLDHAGMVMMPFHHVNLFDESLLDRHRDGIAVRSA